MTSRIENSHAQRHAANKNDIREANTNKIYGHLKLLGIINKAGSNGHGQRPSQYFHKHGDGDEYTGQPNHGGPGHGLSCFLALFLNGPRINRNKGHGQRPFAKKPPQKIRNTESHEKGIGKKPGTQRKGDDDIPDKSQNTRNQRGSSHDSRIFRYYFCVFIHCILCAMPSIFRQHGTQL